MARDRFYSASSMAARRQGEGLAGCSNGRPHSLTLDANRLGELEHLGVAFISYRHNIDLSTSRPLHGSDTRSMGEFEKSLIQERVLAALRNARAKGKKLGRPKRTIDLAQIQKLRARPRATWQSVASEFNVPLSTLFSSALKLADQQRCLRCAAKRTMCT